MFWVQNILNPELGSRVEALLDPNGSKKASTRDLGPGLRPFWVDPGAFFKFFFIKTTEKSIFVHEKPQKKQVFSGKNTPKTFLLMKKTKKTSFSWKKTCFFIKKTQKTLFFHKKHACSQKNRNNN